MTEDEAHHEYKRRRNEDSWHFDKKVPVGLIIFFVLQTAMFSFWMGGLEKRIHNLESTQATLCSNEKYDAFVQLLNERQFDNDGKFEDLEDHVGDVKSAINEVRSLILQIHLESGDSKTASNGKGDT